MLRCYIRHEMLEEVRAKLFALGAPGLSVSDVKGIGKPMSQMRSAPDPAASQLPQFLPRVEITVVLDDDAVDEVVKALLEVLRTGQQGDGKIFILPVEETIRVRTGETGQQALY